MVRASAALRCSACNLSGLGLPASLSEVRAAHLAVTAATSSLKRSSIGLVSLVAVLRRVIQTKCGKLCVSESRTRCAGD